MVLPAADATVVSANDMATPARMAAVNFFMISSLHP